MKTVYNNKNLDIKVQVMIASVGSSIQAERFVFVTWGDRVFQYTEENCGMPEDFVRYICNMITAAEYGEVIAAITKATLTPR